MNEAKIQAKTNVDISAGKHIQLKSSRVSIVSSDDISINSLGSMNISVFNKGKISTGINPLGGDLELSTDINGNVIVNAGISKVGVGDVLINSGSLKGNIKMKVVPPGVLSIDTKLSPNSIQLGGTTFHVAKAEATQTTLTHLINKLDQLAFFVDNHFHIGNLGGSTPIGIKSGITFSSLSADIEKIDSLMVTLGL